jgi:hypothetical protein
MDVCNYLPPKIALKIFGSVFNDSLSILALRLAAAVNIVFKIQIFF